jgi:hypothetical protein
MYPVTVSSLVALNMREYLSGKSLKEKLKRFNSYYFAYISNSITIDLFGFTVRSSRYFYGWIKLPSSS